ncbi:MAG TPA: hypothetical protein VKV39_04890 [Candidatus Sulfotelmatobacter sp.]|nr:hypothetical protein [Candidatus Sulfotelmatobacter sp.]
MRFACLFSLFLLGATLAVAQSDKDTNFAAGPQYLITAGSPMFLHPIATPSLSLGQPLPAITGSATTESEQAAEPSQATPDQTFLGDVYWGDHPDSEIVGRRLATPSMTPSQTAWYMDKVAQEVANPAPQSPAEPAAGSGFVEITSGQLPANLPASIMDPGVTGTANEQLLRERGYGAPLGDVAAYWKSHKGHALHIFTNSDLERLHGG